ncbi:hypothetical protein [Streptosporangium pseudovulgare]|uniref:hypothetical protein n=1 Tax=Streptosporangium pseudovulgare TaxID=35765 RepID=UPI0016714175|nr:hypothetical protein [Streptosporangium pseudovulgare]
MSDYFDELAALLRDRGVPAERVASTIEELAGHVAESGADPEEEFGPVAAFADSLGGDTGAAGDDGTAGDGRAASAGESWSWTADIFADERRLNEFGEQGWEVDRVDRRGMFVSHRDSERPQRWEYRRETVWPEGRSAVTERLAPDGWEPCGTWFLYEYFKRPGAASVGPAAEIGSPPPAPGGRLFFSARFLLILVAFVLLTVVAGWVVVGFIGSAGSGDDGAGFAAGVAVGVAVVGGAAAALWSLARRDR